MSVVELFLRATAQPRLWGLKLRSCCMKSELSIRAMSAKWRSHRIWLKKWKMGKHMSDLTFFFCGLFLPGAKPSGIRTELLT